MNSVKLKVLKSAVDSLYNLEEYNNPIQFVPTTIKATENLNFVVDLLKRRILPERDDDLAEFYLKKSDWFIAFLEKHNISKDKIEYAKIFVNETERVVEIKTTDGRVFKKETRNEK